MKISSPQDQLNMTKQLCKHLQPTTMTPVTPVTPVPAMNNTNNNNSIEEDLAWIQTDNDESDHALDHATVTIL